jgi:hypothetical protein
MPGGLSRAVFRRKLSTIWGRKLGCCAPEKSPFDPLRGGKTAFSIAPEGVGPQNVKIGKTVLCSFVDFRSILFRKRGLFAFLIAKCVCPYREPSMRSPSYPQSSRSAEFHPTWGYTIGCGWQDGQDKGDSTAENAETDETAPTGRRNRRARVARESPSPRRGEKRGKES